MWPVPYQQLSRFVEGLRIQGDHLPLARLPWLRLFPWLRRHNWRPVVPSWVRAKVDAPVVVCLAFFRAGVSLKADPR